MGIVAILDLLQKSSPFCKSNHFQNLRLLLQSASANAPATVAGVCDILFGMRRCRINLPNRCYHLISRVAHRAFFLDDEVYQ